MASDNARGPTFVVESIDEQAPPDQQEVVRTRLRAASPEAAVEVLRCEGHYPLAVHLIERNRLRARSWDVQNDGSLTPQPSLLQRRPIAVIGAGIAVGILVGYLLVLVVTLVIGRSL